MKFKYQHGIKTSYWAEQQREDVWGTQCHEKHQQLEKIIKARLHAVRFMSASLQIRASSPAHSDQAIRARAMRLWPSSDIRTVCPHCAFGCQQVVHVCAPTSKPTAFVPVLLILHCDVLFLWLSAKYRNSQFSAILCPSLLESFRPFLVINKVLWQPAQRQLFNVSGSYVSTINFGSDISKGPYEKLKFTSTTVQKIKVCTCFIE